MAPVVRSRVAGSLFYEQCILSLFIVVPLAIMLRMKWRMHASLQPARSTAVWEKTMSEFTLLLALYLSYYVMIFVETRKYSTREQRIWLRLNGNGSWEANK